MNNELQVAILFYKLMDDSNVELFVPARVLLGKLNKDETKFYDIISQTVVNYLDNFSGTGVENYTGFYYPISLSSFTIKKFPEDFVTEISNYMSEIKKKAYFYSLETGEISDYKLKSLPLDEFHKKYGLKVNYSFVPTDINNIDFDKLLNANRKLNELAEDNMPDDYEKLEQLDIPPIDEVYENIKKNVLCQDNQIKTILTAIYKNLVFSDPSIKSNVLIYGPSGVGKTAILKQIGEHLNIPVVIEDSTLYTVSGYRGKDCEEVLKHLYMAANGDQALAEHGILVLDEIDKKNKKGSNDEGVTTEGVLNSLLKIVEGGMFEVTISEKTDEVINFDTSHLTVIVSGAFEKMLNEKSKTKQIGFSNGVINTDLVKENSDITSQFIKYGMPKEFIGRFNTFVKLNSLTKDDLKYILLNSDRSVLKLFVKHLKNLGINLKFDDKLVEDICSLAYARNTGARSLNNIVSDLLNDSLYDVFSSTNEKNEIVLDQKVLNKNVMIKKEEKNEKPIVKVKTL